MDLTQMCAAVGAGAQRECRRSSLARFLGSAARLVVEGVADLELSLGHTLGQQRLAAYLGGSDSDFMRANGLTALPHYGVFASCRRAWVCRLIDALRDAGYLRVSGDLRPVLVLEPEAGELVRNPDEMPLLGQEVLDDPLLGPTGPRSAAEEQLRRLRTRLSQAAGSPAGQVLPDAVIRSLSQRPPRDRDELARLLPEPARVHADAVWATLAAGNGQDSASA